MQEIYWKRPEDHFTHNRPWVRLRKTRIRIPDASTPRLVGQRCPLNSQLKMMAADAPITPKKPAYGGAEGSYESLDIFTEVLEER